MAGCRPAGTCEGNTGPTMSPVMSPYPLPACDPGGSTVPPIKPHRGDPGPGRLEEGVALPFHRFSLFVIFILGRTTGGGIPNI